MSWTDKQKVVFDEIRAAADKTSINLLFYTILMIKKEIKSFVRIRELSNTPIKGNFDLDHFEKRTEKIAQKEKSASMEL